MIYSTNKVDVPNLDILSLIFDSKYANSNEETPLHAEARAPDQVITKGQSRKLTKNFAHFLRHEYGIGASGPGHDVVVGFSVGQSALASFFYGVIAAGGVFSAATPSATPSELARQIRDGPARALACSKELEPVALKAAAEAGLPRSSVLVLESLPEVRLSISGQSRGCDFQKTLEWEAISDPATLKTRTACLVYSSGTTGLPKGVRLSHLNLVSSIILTSSLTRPHSEAWRTKEGWKGRVLGHLPPAHIAGIAGYFINPIFEGHIVYWMPSFNFEDFAKYNDKLKITVMFSVPPIWMAIAKHPAVKDQFRHVRSALSGAAPLSTEIQDLVGAKIDGVLRQTWGMTENGGSATYAPPGRMDTLGSLGPLMPNVELRLVDEDGKDVAPGEAGEALLRGPVVTIGYHNNEEANRSTFTHDGWMRTGDILRVEDDLVYVVDRKKELIKYKGHQVAPAELEGILASHPAVSDAAVLGVPSNGTEVPKAYVVRAPDVSNPVTEQALIQYVKEKVAPHKQLRGGVEFIDIIPRSPAGKILRRKLRERQSKL
ncbi:AMP-binding enzyme domain-containing protein [Sarocladium implicatum]|nr:AMP-binding enzyme domain-containing protein [Sarocladium implicatum]